MYKIRSFNDAFKPLVIYVLIKNVIDLRNMKHRSLEKGTLEKGTRLTIPEGKKETACSLEVEVPSSLFHGGSLVC